jgi:hypothetical protein
MSGNNSKMIGTMMMMRFWNANEWKEILSIA